MKKIIASSLLSVLLLSSVALAQTPSTDTSTSDANQDSKQEIGTSNQDTASQIKALKKEMNSKIKAIREEYQVKIDALRAVAKANAQASLIAAKTKTKAKHKQGLYLKKIKKSSKYSNNATSTPKNQ